MTQNCAKPAYKTRWVCTQNGKTIKKTSTPVTRLQGASTKIASVPDATWVARKVDMSATNQYHKIVILGGRRART